jgi:uncharacterized SAM-dependent methyltransferase
MPSLPPAYQRELDQISYISQKVGRDLGFILNTRLADKGSVVIKPYLAAVRALTEAAKIEGEDDVLIEGKLARLLQLSCTDYIPDLRNPVVAHYIYENRLPPFSWGGAAMLKALTRGDRKQSYENEKEIAGKLGIEAAHRPYVPGHPVCYIDLGSGDGEKGIERARHDLESKLNITYVPVDSNKEAVEMSEASARREFSRLAEAHDFQVIPVLNRFENLPESEYFKAIIWKNPNRVFLFYGSTAANFDPPLAVIMLRNLMSQGDYVELGLQLCSGDENSIDRILNAFGNDDAREVSVEGLKVLNFSAEDIKSMGYRAEVLTTGYDEFSEYDLGFLTVVKTFFIANTSLEAGLVHLKKGDRLDATARYLYTHEQFRKVFEHGGFEILGKHQKGNEAIFQMRKK